MVQWWDVLGVDRATIEMRKIKRAYSRKLKQIDQEKDPNAFFELRDAYERARAYTQNGDSVSGNINLDMSDALNVESVDIMRGDHDQQLFDPLSGPSPVSNTHMSEFEDSDLLKQIVFDADKLMRSSERRQDKNNWATVFDDMQDLSVDDYLSAENSILYNMLEYCFEVVNNRSQNRIDSGYRPHFMSFETASFVFDHFGWNDPDNPKRFNPQISELRHWLDVHTKKAQLSPEPEPQKFELDDIDWSTLLGIIPPVIAIFYVIYRIFSAGG